MHIHSNFPSVSPVDPYSPVANKASQKAMTTERRKLKRTLNTSTDTEMIAEFDDGSALARWMTAQKIDIEADLGEESSHPRLFSDFV